MKKKRKIIITTLGLVLLLALIALFIWPTMYTKEKLNMGMFGTQTIRTNRFTGDKEVYGSKKWQPIIISSDGNVTIPAGTQLMVR